MDLPKLTLVKDAGYVVNECGTTKNETPDNIEGEDWLIDVRDLEGIDVEEVEDEDDGGNVMKVDEIERIDGCSDLSDADEDEFGVEEEVTAFEFSRCTECKVQDGPRPVQELCGHVKCRDCYISSNDGCRQCIRILFTKGRSESPYGEETEADIHDEQNHNDEVDEQEDRLVVKPDEYIFEFGGVSGSKSLAVVSRETLKGLGIPVDDHKNREQEESDSFIAAGKFQKDVDASNSSINTRPVTLVTKPEDDNEEQTGASAEGEMSQKNKRKPEMKTGHIVLVDNVPVLGPDLTAKWKCLKCDKDFNHEYQRKYHIYCDPSNGRRPFVCHCSEEFVSQSHYLYHVRSKHTGEKPYECPVCAQRFIQKVKLNRHMITHTSKPKSALSSAYLCAYCQKRFKSMQSCKRHIRNHTDDKPFECNICHKCFKQKYSLDIHKKIHRNERPHRCPDCEKAFSTAKDMKRHHLIHTGELPFECAVCHVKFRRKDNLERHIRSAHKLSEKLSKVFGKEALKQYKRSKKSQENDSAISEER